MRGNKKPLVVDFKSRMAEALVPPFGFISIDWADATKEVKIESKISVFFITAGFLMYSGFIVLVINACIVLK
jgi:hypothetical protein